MGLSPEENRAMVHFNEHHTRDEDGRFIVPLPRKENVPPLGESRTQAICRFRSLERSLWTKGKFGNFAEVMQEYFKKDHAEQLLLEEVDSPMGRYTKRIAPPANFRLYLMCLQRRRWALL